MQEKSDELYDLIQSLTSAERRYFKIYFRGLAHGELEKYIQVFDVLAQSKVFNKDALLNAVPGDVVRKYYSKTKAYLLDVILEAMRSYAKGGGNYYAEVYAAIADIRFLLSKKQNTHAIRLIEKLKQRTIDAEDFANALELLYIEESIYQGLTDEIAKVHVQMNKIFSAVKTENELSSLHWEIFKLESQCSTRPSSAQQELIQQYLQQLASYQPANLTMDARRKLYSAQTVCYFMLSEFTTAHKYISQYLTEFRVQNKHYKSIRESAYLRAMQNAMSSAFRTRNLEFYKTTAQFIQELMDEVEGHEHVKFEHYLTLQFGLISLSGDYSHFTESVEHVEQNKHLIQNFIPVRRVELSFNIAIGYFKCGNLSASIDWLNRFLTDPDVELFTATLNHARIFEILLHWKLHNTALVISRARSFQRVLKDMKSSGKFEKELLRFINAIAGKEDYHNIHKELQMFRTRLAQLDASTYAGIIRHYEELIQVFLE
ncbi:MAG: hypothetical protein U0Y96_03460 [Candidatus Kapaibacterium sp.]|nr:hypothetical protein [Bacteroidota bacterium]